MQRNKIFFHKWCFISSVEIDLHNQIEEIDTSSMWFGFSSKSQKRPGRADTVDGMTTTGNHGSVQTDRDKCFLDTSMPNHHASNQRLLLGTGSFQDTADDLLQRNVVSVAQLASSHGLITVFEPTGCYMKDKKTGQIVAHGHLRDGAFVLDNLLINQVAALGQCNSTRTINYYALHSTFLLSLIFYKSNFNSAK